MSPHDELKAILQEVRKNLVTLAGRIDAIEPELTGLKRIAIAAATVAAETNEKVNDLHSRLIETTDRHGARIYALEHPNGHANGKAR